eukprot:9775939-Lingulodinium_polyedra.AAC.1
MARSGCLRNRQDLRQAPERLENAGEVVLRSARGPLREAVDDRNHGWRRRLAGHRASGFPAPIA